MDRYLVYNGLSSASFSMFISGTRTYVGAEKDYEVVEIEGLNGDLLIDKNRYKNVDIVYECFIRDQAIANMKDVRNFLLHDFQYHKLEDTYDPEHYRFGYYTGGFNPNVVNMKTAKFDLEFHCKPQRFLKAGDLWKSFTQTDVIYNPTLFNAKPILRVYGKGTIGINDSVVTINSTGNNYIDVDCELCRAYEVTDGVLFNRNSNVSVTDYKFPVLTSGVNDIRLSGVSKVEIKARWWEL